MQFFFLKILSGIANSPLRAVRSGSMLFAYTIMSDTLVYEILGHLSYCLVPSNPMAADKALFLTKKYRAQRFKASLA